MKYILISLLLNNGWTAEFDSLNACQTAIREIHSQRVNPPGQRLKELEPVIDVQMRTSREYLCVKKS